jgi:hypothetical protein
MTMSRYPAQNVPGKSLALAVPFTSMLTASSSASRGTPHCVLSAYEVARKRLPLPPCWWYAGIRPVPLETGAAVLAEPAADRTVKRS